MPSEVALSLANLQAQVWLSLLFILIFHGLSILECLRACIILLSLLRRGEGRANLGSLWFLFIFSLYRSALDHSATVPSIVSRRFPSPVRDYSTI